MTMFVVALLCVLQAEQPSGSGYFGILRVEQEDRENYRRLVHGTNLHGQPPNHRKQPATIGLGSGTATTWGRSGGVCRFYEIDLPPNGDNPGKHLGTHAKSGPLGDVFRAFKGDERLQAVGVVGGSEDGLTAYSEPSQKRVLFERIDATGWLVERKDQLAQNMKDVRCGLLVINGVDSEGVHVRLLTREAVALYRKRLTDNGFLVFHITNPTFDLEPVLARLADEAKCVAYVRHYEPTEADKKAGASASSWLVVARHKEALAPLLKNDKWKLARTERDVPLWTDDYADLLPALRK